MVGFFSTVYCVAVAEGRKTSRGADDARVSACRFQSGADRAVGQELAESRGARNDQRAGAVAAGSRFLQISGGALAEGHGESGDFAAQTQSGRKASFAGAGDMLR